MAELSKLGNWFHQGNSEDVGLSNFDIGFIREIRRRLAFLISTLD